MKAKLIGYAVIITLAVLLWLHWGGLTNTFALLILTIFSTLACFRWADFVEERLK